MSNNHEKPGYKNPPKHSRFRPGQSGNPRGRPKKNEDHLTILEKILDEKLNMSVEDKTKKLSVKEGLLRRAIARALKEGRWRDVKEILEYAEKLMDQASTSQRTGVLVVPATMPIEDFLRKYGTPGSSKPPIDDETYDEKIQQKAANKENKEWYED